MKLKVFLLGIVIVLLGIVGETIQQAPYYQQQNDFQLPAGISVPNTEWVCKNPKTGDMMIIATEDAPAQNGNVQGTWYPQQQPNYPKYPNDQPTFPQKVPSFQTVKKTQQSNQGTTPNTNGEGIIDIRFGNDKNASQ